MEDSLWLVGAGSMAQEYAKVLLDLKQPFLTVGNSTHGCERFHAATGTKAVAGGVEQALANQPSPRQAIVAVGIESLSTCAAALLRAGVKTLLVEKPGVGFAQELPSLCSLAEEMGAVVLLAYNRRFYEASRQARRLIAEDGGVRSFFFEFTEWSHQISQLKKHKVEWENWFLGNSSHVVDLAFHLGGTPVELNSYVSGSLDWHSRSANFAGSGRTRSGALFSYLADWAAPGRWGIEMLTQRARYIFRPMEKLARMEIGSVAVQPVEIDDDLDTRYKPGVFLQTRCFLEGQWEDFVTLREQQKRMALLCKIGGYEYP